MSPTRCRALGFALLAVVARGCTNFAMENSFNLSVRTFDFGSSLEPHEIVTVPAGSGGLRSSKHGYVAIVPGVRGEQRVLFGGLNDVGVSCDVLTLMGSKYPANNSSLDNLPVEKLCQWTLESHASTAEVKEGLRHMNFVDTRPDAYFSGGLHFSIRDALGQAVAVEFMGGAMQVYDNNNDEGVTGFGVLTNQPDFPWQLRAMQHLLWKKRLARPDVAMPGSWYPDERFQRAYLVKSGMVAPTSYQDAVMQAVETLNTITVPMGRQLGTDTGSSMGDKPGDHTTWGVIYDHVNRVLYWRTERNQNLQRLRLADAGVAVGGEKRYMPVLSWSSPWFNDASSQLASPTPAQDGMVLV